jgi:DNA-binding NarL/FixJ family response regulator
MGNMRSPICGFVISRATEVHLAHVFQKLDVSSRSELTAQAVRREM